MQIRKIALTSSLALGATMLFAPNIAAAAMTPDMAIHSMAPAPGEQFAPDYSQFDGLNQVESIFKEALDKVTAVEAEALDTLAAAKQQTVLMIDNAVRRVRIGGSSVD